MRRGVVFLFLFSSFLLQSCGNNGFWGKVIDQNNIPVSDVEIFYLAGQGSIISGGQTYGYCKTDQMGFFFIKSPGTLDFRNMKKDGCQIALYPQERFFHAHKKSPDDRIYTDFTKENPYIFHAWKYSDTDDLGKLIHGESTVYFKADGEGYSVDLFGTRKQDNKKDFDNGQLKIQFSREAELWKFVLTSINGGILEVDSMYSNEAPKEGYKKSIVITQNDYKNSGYNKTMHNYYISMNNKKIFARLSFELRPFFRDDEGLINARYTINPTGERYLDTFDGWAKIEKWR